MTPEQRIARAERMLILFVKAGRRNRSEWRKESREQGDQIDILINAQIATEDQIKRTDEQIRKTDEQIEALVASQAKTDEALRRTEEAVRRFINSLSKGRNGNSEN